MYIKIIQYKNIQFVGLKKINWAFFFLLIRNRCITTDLIGKGNIYWLQLSQGSGMIK